MARLHYPKRARFVDRSRGFQYTGPGTTDVPDDAVDDYLARGWVEPETDTGSADTDTPERREDTTIEPDTAGLNTEVTAGEIEQEPVPEDRTEPDTETATAQADEFDADDFIDDSWGSVSNTISEGAVDDYLDEIERAERDRANGPRGSVMGTITSRREATDTGPDRDTEG